MIAPFLYHEILKCGTDGGVRLNFPEMLICGNFSFGRLQEKLKNPLILSIAFFTASLAALIGVVIALLMEFQTVVAVLFTLLTTFDTVALIPLTTLLTVDFAALIGV